MLPRVSPRTHRSNTFTDLLHPVIHNFAGAFHLLAIDFNMEGREKNGSVLRFLVKEFPPAENFCVKIRFGKLIVVALIRYLPIMLSTLRCPVIQSYPKW